MSLTVQTHKPLTEIAYKTLEQMQAESKANEQKWDGRFLALAGHYAGWSKDPSTKVGCVIVSRDKTVVASGYNGLPRGADDDDPTRSIRPEKLFWYEHAERNAIYNSAKRGIALSSTTLYSTLCPCMDCARGIVQSGIKRVVCPKPDLEKYSMWADQFKKVEILFTECNVELNYV